MTIYPPDIPQTFPEWFTRLRDEKERDDLLQGLLRPRAVYQVCIKSIEVEQVSALLMAASSWRFVLSVSASSDRLPQEAFFRARFIYIDLSDIEIRVGGPVGPGPQNLKVVEVCSPAVENLESFALSGQSLDAEGELMGDLPSLVVTGDLQDLLDGATHSISVANPYDRYTVTFCVRRAQRRGLFISFDGAGENRSISTQEALDFAGYVGAEVVRVDSTGLHVECYDDFRPLETRWRRLPCKGDG